MHVDGTMCDSLQAQACSFDMWPKFKTTIQHTLTNEDLITHSICSAYVQFIHSCNTV